MPSSCSRCSASSEQPLEDPLPRLVVGDQLDDVVALGGGVLRVAADVEVEPGAVAQEDVAAAAPADDLAEQVAGHLVGAQPALALERARDAVLVLDAEDPPVHARQPYGRRRSDGASRARTCAGRDSPASEPFEPRLAPITRTPSVRLPGTRVHRLARRRAMCSRSPTGSSVRAVLATRSTSPLVAPVDGGGGRRSPGPSGRSRRRRGRRRRRPCRSACSAPPRRVGVGPRSPSISASRAGRIRLNLRGCVRVRSSTATSRSSAGITRSSPSRAWPERRDGDAEGLGERGALGVVLLEVRRDLSAAPPITA